MFYSCGDIFDEKYGEKEKRTNIGKNKHEKAGSQSHDTTKFMINQMILIWIL